MFSCKLYHNLLQTIILRIVISFQCWAVEYDLIAQRAVVDLKSVTSIWAHLDMLSLNDVSYEHIASHCFPRMLLRILSDPMCYHRLYGVLGSVLILSQTQTWR